jgi:hypothetical protein
LCVCVCVCVCTRELVEGLDERDVELLLLLLRQCGPKLRADDPAALKDIVLAVQVRRMCVCVYVCVCMLYVCYVSAAHDPPHSRTSCWPCRCGGVRVCMFRCMYDV